MTILIWIFAAYLLLSIAVLGLTTFLSKKIIRRVILEHPGTLEKIFADPRQLSLVKKGYAINLLLKQDLSGLVAQKIVDDMKKILPLQYISYALLSGLVIFLVVMVIMMPGKPAL